MLKWRSEKRKADKASRENEEKDEQIRKENEEKDERIRKENEEKDERIRKENEEKDERIRKENEEKDERIRKENEEKDEQIREENEEKDGRIGKQKDRLKAVEKHFREKIGREIKNMNDEGSSFLEDIERNMSEVKELMRGYLDIFLRIEEFGEVYKDTFGNKYDEQNDKMDTFIREMMKKVQNIKLDDIKALERHAKAIENDKYECAKKEKIDVCNNIGDNISERVSNLEHKCNVEVGGLMDCQVLERKKESTLNSGFNDILDRVTNLVQVNLSEFEETSGLMHTTRKKKINLKNLMHLYLANLDKEIIAHDLSEEKLRNASILKLALPKFKGYNSSIDYYTFKAEFENLISPRVHSKLLPDYLKNNYLEGQALQIVKEINDIDKIWDRLKSSFGNVAFLLNNKLEEIEKGIPLWKIKSDEKVVQSITKIKNSMIELSSLAKKT